MKETENKRYTVLDMLRGFAVISMVVYHILWDLVAVAGVSIPWFYAKTAFLFQQSICFSFILISGFSFCLGKGKLKRAITVIICAVIISLVTAIFIPENIILFGVLSLIGSAMLITYLLEKALKRISPYIGLTIASILFIVTYNMKNGGLGILKYTVIKLPKFLYANYLTTFLGLPFSDFASSDYVPLFPWLFLFFAGFFLYMIFEKRGLLRYLSRISFAPLEIIGRHSLIIYMLHQPIIYALVVLFATI